MGPRKILVVVNVLRLENFTVFLCIRRDLKNLSMLDKFPLYTESNLQRVSVLRGQHIYMTNIKPVVKNIGLCCLKKISSILHIDELIFYCR